MMLAMRTDKPEAELFLFDAQGAELEKLVWHAHRSLSTTILTQIEGLLSKQKSEFSKLQAIIFYEGPGSFTGLRIGASVANALGYGLQIPVYSVGGEGWIKEGLAMLGEKSSLALPAYGAGPHVTAQKK